MNLNLKFKEKKTSIQGRVFQVCCNKDSPSLGLERFIFLDVSSSGLATPDTQTEHVFFLSLYLEIASAGPNGTTTHKSRHRSSPSAMETTQYEFIPYSTTKGREREKEINIIINRTSGKGAPSMVSQFFIFDGFTVRRDDDQLKPCLVRETSRLPVERRGSLFFHLFYFFFFSFYYLSVCVSVTKSKVFLFSFQNESLREVGGFSCSLHCVKFTTTLLL
jgi:hypothetical protein